MNKNFKIDFIGIGTGRSASTWIYECLKEHPEICMSKRKETKFLFKNNNTKEYSNFFQKCDKDKLIGEYTPGYMYSYEAAKNIKKVNSNIKIIACLRNPIERTISSYYFSKTRGEVLFDDLEQRINDDLDNFENEKISYIERGNYFKYLKHYFRLFPHKNIFVTIFEDIEKNPKKFIHELYNFLDVESNFMPPSLEQKINFATNNRRHFPGFTKLFFQTREKLNNTKKGKAIIKIIKILQLNRIVILLLNLNLKNVKNTKIIEIKKQPLSQKTKQRLLKLFKNDIENLEKIINRDLSHWKL